MNEYNRVTPTDAERDACSVKHNDALRADRTARMNAMHTGTYRAGE